MSARKCLAVIGAGAIVLHFALSAYGYHSPKEYLMKLIQNQDLITASVEVELGGFHTAMPAEPEVTAVLPSPTPTAVPLTPEPAPESTAEILETSVAGGLTIDNSTSYAIDTAQLLADGPDLILPKDQPQILIIHTHSSEAYTMDDFDQYEPSDTSRTEDTHYNIIRVGDELTAALQNCGLNVIHDRGIYDYPSYTGSYNRTAEAIQAYLQQYPTISMVIDLHRDAIGDDDVVYKTVAVNDDITSSQVMFVVGSNGSGLEHPNWEKNLKLALYLQSAVNASYPSLMRPIKLVNERYNQQLTDGSLIIEVGSSGNTLQEALAAVRLFADAAGPALAQRIA